MNTTTLLLRFAALSVLAIFTSGCLSQEKPFDETAIDDGGTASNAAPVISGTPPAAATVGNQYSFTPNASDPNGDSLTFAISNLPGWASFDANTGRVSGVPSMGDVGVYDNIQLTVSDGQASTMASFSINVSQVGLGSVTVSWTPPTRNSDGTTLTDLAGYRIYYGLSASAMTQFVQVNNPGVTRFVVDNLVPDTYFLTATAVNSSGVESTFSNTVSKVVSAN